MPSLWTQIIDPNLQLFLSLVIGFATLECLVALWAAIATVHWFWRALAVWAATMLMLPIHAWELACVFGLAALLLTAIAKIGPWIVRQLDRSPRPRSSASRWRYSLQELFLIVFCICVWLPGLATIFRNVKASSWPAILGASASLAGLAMLSAKLVIGPRRIRAVILLLVALPISAATLWAVVRGEYAWMLTGGYGTDAWDIVSVAIRELEFVLFLMATLALIRASSSTRPQRWLAATALGSLAAISAIWLIYIYVLLIERPPIATKLELATNRYDKIFGIAQRMNAINPGNDSMDTLRASSKNRVADELETLYAQLLPLLADENAVPYDPDAAGTREFFEAAFFGHVQILRDLCRDLQAESESARARGQFELAADYALACLRLGEMEGRGGLAVNALVGDAFEGVAYAQLSKLRAELPDQKLCEIIAALEECPSRRDDPSKLRFRELDYGERSYGSWFRLHNLFLKLTGNKEPWEQALAEANRRHGAMNAMLRADGAIRRFLKEQGHPPRSLESLVPDFLPAIPIDPYNEKPLCYRTQNEDWVVYSVGRDRNDNGGKFGSWQDYWSSAGGYDLDLDTITRP